LANLLSRLDNALRAAGRAGVILNELDRLSPPPALTETARLGETIARLEHFTRQTKRLAMGLQRLACLSPPPDAPVALESLRAAIAALESAQLLDRNLGAQAADLNSQLSAAREDMLAWTAANPLCPTCGAATSVERLVESAPRNRGGHGH
jgi:hypothetical protein